MKGLMKQLQNCRWLALLLITVMLVQLVGCGGGGGSANPKQSKETMSVEELKSIAELPDDWQKADFILLEDGSARLPDGTVTHDVESLFSKKQLTRAQDEAYHILKTNFLIPIKNKTINFSLHDGWLWGYNAYDIGKNGNGHQFQIDETVYKTTPHWNFAIYANYDDMYQDQYVEESNKRSLINIHYGKDARTGCWFYSITVYASSNPDRHKRVKLFGQDNIGCGDPTARELNSKMCDDLIPAMTIAKYVVVVLVAIVIIRLLIAPAVALAAESNQPSPPVEGTPCGPYDTNEEIAPDGTTVDEPPTDPGGSSGSTTPDTTPPNVLTAGCRVEPTGDGKFAIAVAFDASDFNSGWIQLQDSNGANHGIGGQNWTNPVILEHNMTGWPYGVYKVMTWAKDNAENASQLMDTGLKIGWGAPKIIDQLLSDPTSTGQIPYWVKVESLGGPDQIDWVAFNYWVGSRYYQIGGLVHAAEASWLINPLDYPEMERGKVYPLTVSIKDKNGILAEHLAVNRYLTVPQVVIPLERGRESLVKYEPSSTVPWHSNDTYLATSGWNGPYGPANFNVNLNIYVEGTQHHSSTEHCPTVYGKGGGAGYKVMGAWGYGYWMHLYGNIADLPTGLHAIGAEMKWDGRTTGPIRAKDGWIWVDNDHPLFDKIIEGPASGSTIRKSQSTELCIRTTIQDPGGSGTAEYWLALVGQGEERGFKERIYGYTGINHCTLTGLPNGQYRLYVSYSRDQVGNAQSRSISTDVTFEIAD